MASSERHTKSFTAESRSWEGSTFLWWWIPVGSHRHGLFTGRYSEQRMLGSFTRESAFARAQITFLQWWTPVYVSLTHHKKRGSYSHVWRAPYDSQPWHVCKSHHQRHRIACSKNFSLNFTGELRSRTQRTFPWWRALVYASLARLKQTGSHANYSHTVRSRNVIMITNSRELHVSVNLGKCANYITKDIP